MVSALVLSAGLGTRLGAITKTLAKPAVPIGDQTIGERVLRWLRREGITDVVMNLHHLPHTITGVIGDGAHLGMTVRYSWEPVLLGSAGGPRHALPLINSDPFLIVNGDTLTNAALGPILDAHRHTQADVTMVVIRNPAPDRYNGVLADADNVVTGFISKGHTTPSWHFVGIQVVNKSVFAPLPDDTPIETVSGVYREMIGTLPRVRIFPVDAEFFDVGTPEDYETTCRVFATRTTSGSN
jgi:NDP-sugar pyrophosphorylase family protein